MHLGKLGVCAQVLFVLKADFFLPSPTESPRQSCRGYAPPQGYLGGAPTVQSAAPAHGPKIRRERAVAPHHRTLSASSCFCSFSLSEEDMVQPLHGFGFFFVFFYKNQRGGVFCLR